MIDEKRLLQLARLESDEGIVSLYLRFEPRLMYERGLAITKLKSAVERFERRESSEEKRNAVRRERGRIEAFLADWTPAGRSLALFACDPAGIWEQFALSVSVPTLLAVDRKIRTRPLALLLDEFPRLVVCVVQRDRSTFYVSEQREGERAGSVSSAVPGRHSTGGWSQARFARHTEVHVQKHLREVVAFLEEMAAQESFDRLILCGTAEVTHETERLLPNHLRDRLIASLPVDLKHDSEDEILERARAASQEAERREEEKLVRQISDRADGGGRGVVGLDPTLQALGEGRIEKMVLTEDFAHAGWECEKCDYVSTSELARCPICGGSGHPVPNVVDVAVERAFLSGIGIDFVFADRARALLAERGDIGALLRY